MDPANRNETSAMTLSRVEQNDPDLGQLEVNSTDRVVENNSGNYWPNDRVDLARLGDAIGANTSLWSLGICSADELVDMAANNAAFFEGLNRNNFIEFLILSDCDVSGGMGRDILNGFVANNSNLTVIKLFRCTLGNGGAGALTSVVTNCTNMSTIRLSSCNIDDDILVEFVSGIRSLHQLRRLHLSGNIFGRAGCEALATLLKDPNGNLRSLDLIGNNRIDDNCATILAKSLKVNRKLERLDLCGSAITESGWDAFSQVLCNTSSVNDTFLSNHTMKNPGFVFLPINISTLLYLNCGVDKKQVVIQKILRSHAHFDMEPFLEWDLKVLPLAVSWFDRARDYAQNDESNIDARKLSAIYQFARALPMMFVPPTNKTKKRRTGEVN